MAVADPRAEGGGAGDVLPAGRLEACLLALAHPAWGQKDGVITAHYDSYRQTEREGGSRGGMKKDMRDMLPSYFWLEYRCSLLVFDYIIWLLK